MITQFKEVFTCALISVAATLVLWGVVSLVNDKVGVSQSNYGVTLIRG